MIFIKILAVDAHSTNARGTTTNITTADNAIVKDIDSRKSFVGNAVLSKLLGT